MSGRCVSNLVQVPLLAPFVPEDLAALVALADGRALGAATLLAQSVVDAARFGSPGARTGPAGPAGVAVRMWQETAPEDAHAAILVARALRWRSDATAATDGILAWAAVRAAAARGYPHDTAACAAGLAVAWGLAGLALVLTPPAGGLPEFVPAPIGNTADPATEVVVQSALRALEPRALSAAQASALAVLFGEAGPADRPCSEIDVLLAVHAVHRSQEGIATPAGPWTERIARAMARMRSADPFPVVPGAATAAARLGYVPGAGWLWDGTEAVLSRLGGA